MVPGRSSKQCRDRWLSICPAVEKREWSAEEDNLLVELHRKYKNRWVKIAAHFEGRNDNMIKSRFRALSRLGLVSKEHTDTTRGTQKRGCEELGAASSAAGAPTREFKRLFTGEREKALASFTSSSTVSMSSLFEWENFEDEPLVELVKAVGAQWAFIASKLSGQNETEVQHRYALLLAQEQQRQHQLSALLSEPPRRKSELELFLEKLQRAQQDQQQKQQQQMLLSQFFTDVQSPRAYSTGLLKSGGLSSAASSPKDEMPFFSQQFQISPRPQLVSSLSSPWDTVPSK
jgi:hypothetical protein